MNTSLLINKDDFIKRFTNLCLKSGLPGFPKDGVNQHVLLKSVTFLLDQTTAYTEKEINDILEEWINLVGLGNVIDRITLRRYLVDAGYLARNNDGSKYEISIQGPRLKFFDETVKQINLKEVITAAREEIIRKKKEYQEK